MKKIFFLFIFISVGQMGAVYAVDDTALTEEQKAEKRLLFNRFVLEELAREDYQRLKTEQRQKTEPSYAPRFNVILTPSYGYDRNVTLNSQRSGDTFYQENIEAKYKIKHRGLGLLGPGEWGVGGALDFLNYPNAVSSNYRDMDLSLFGDSKLGERWRLKVQFEMGLLDYIHGDSLGYFQHKVKPNLSYAWNGQWTQNFYSALEHKNYSSKKQLSNTNTPLEDDRKDFSYEAGSGFRWIPDPSKVLGISAGYKRNDSNDLFQDYNDSEDYKLSGYCYLQATPAISLIAFSGLNHKRYDSRAFDAESDESQKDKFFYAGGTAYYDIAKNLQLFLSYLYKQNYSNDHSQEYSGYTVSTGLTLTIG